MRPICRPCLPLRRRAALEPQAILHNIDTSRIAWRCQQKPNESKLCCFCSEHKRSAQTARGRNLPPPESAGAHNFGITALQIRKEDYHMFLYSICSSTKCLTSKLTLKEIKIKGIAHAKGRWTTEVSSPRCPMAILLCLGHLTPI